jgi:hypothetical protein
MGTSITLCCSRTTSICLTTFITCRNVSCACASRVRHNHGHSKYHLARCYQKDKARMVLISERIPPTMLCRCERDMKFHNYLRNNPSKYLLNISTPFIETDVVILT